jgi:hypothetical protein
MASSKKIIELDSETAVYLEKGIESHDVLTYLMSRIGNADKLFISSFAVSDYFCRRLLDYRDRIKEITVLLDFTISSRKKANTIFLSSIADHVYLTKNHSKIISITGNQQAIAIMSNNCTENHRLESGFISFNNQIVNTYQKKIITQLENAAKWN